MEKRAKNLLLKMKKVGEKVRELNQPCDGDGASAG